MDWDLLQRNLPEFQFSERHQIAVEAPARRVWQALNTARVEGSPLTRAAVSLRMLPARLAGREISQPALFDLSGMGSFLRLGEIADSEFVLGMVGQFWLPRGNLAPIQASDFQAFDDPAFAKLAWGFLLVEGSGRTLLKTETRVFCPSAETVRPFRRYWYLIRPISGLIRREILAGIRRQALRIDPSS